MAVAKPITGINVITGSFKDKDRTIKRKLSTDTYTQQKEGKTVLSKKPKRTKKKSQKQEILNNRFYQVECMWKNLSKTQRMAFTAYANKNDLTNRGAKRVYDVFKTLGLKYQLGEFLGEFCNVKITIILEAVTRRTAKITAYFAQTEPVEILMGDLQGLRTVRG